MSHPVGAPPVVDPPLLTCRQAARRAYVTERTIRTWIRTGVLPAKRIGPRLIWVDPKDVDALIRPVCDPQ